MFSNPVIKGFNPDPSICRKDGFYYLAVSTFEYFPGVTVYRSEDLVSWEYEASILNEERILDLHGAKNSVGGIYAPTLRCHDGKFHMVTTNKNIGMNFLVTACDIKGPWSDIKPIRKGGIDPSLFFDDDGTCYYTSNGVVDGERGILCAPIDTETGKLLDKERLITKGISGNSTEAPHIYKKDGVYYLIFAEGGTGMGHHEECARSSSPFGPWEMRGKPILSHRDRKDYIIQATGHADLIETYDGKWGAVFLGIRKAYKPNLHHLGRETFLSPVTWVDGWPVIGNNGYVYMDMDEFEAKKKAKRHFIFDFRKDDLSKVPYLKLRAGNGERYIQDKENGRLTLIGDKKTMLWTKNGEPTLIGFRQTDFYSTFTATVDLKRFRKGVAGIAAWHTNNYYYRIGISRMGPESYYVTSSLMVHGFEARLDSRFVNASDGEAKLTIKAMGDTYYFYVNGLSLGQASYAGLCSEGMMEMSFTGTLFALWAEEGKAVFKDSVKIMNNDLLNGGKLPEQR